MACGLQGDLFCNFVMDSEFEMTKNMICKKKVPALPDWDEFPTLESCDGQRSPLANEWISISFRAETLVGKRTEKKMTQKHDV